MIELEKIPYLKGKPKDILPILLILRRYRDFPDKKDEIKKSILSLIGASESPVRADHYLHARVRPTLVSLNLMEDYKKKYVLTPIGKVVIKHIEDEDYNFSKMQIREKKLMDDYKRKMGSVLMSMDKHTSNIVGILDSVQKMQMEFVSIFDLMLELRKNGLNPCQKLDKERISSEAKYKNLEESGLLKDDVNKGTRLSEILRYFDYFNLVIYRKNEVSLSKVRVNTLRNDKLLNGPDKITDSKLFTVLLEAFESERLRDKRMTPFVPLIPNIRDIVCYKLEISKDTFADKIKMFPPYFNGKQVTLTASREPKPENVTIKRGKISYYYISIVNKGGR